MIRPGEPLGDFGLDPPDDDYEARKSRVVRGYMTELDTLMDELGTLSMACEHADLHDPFGVALSLIKDWIRGVVPNYR